MIKWRNLGSLYSEILFVDKSRALIGQPIVVAYWSRPYWPVSFDCRLDDERPVQILITNK